MINYETAYNFMTTQLKARQVEKAAYSIDAKKYPVKTNINEFGHGPMVDRLKVHSPNTYAIYKKARNDAREAMLALYNTH